MGCRGRVRRSDRLFCGWGFEFSSRPAGRRMRRAGLRLRSGAFAPDCPFLNLVRLRLPTVSVGRIYTPRPPHAPSRRAHDVLVPASRGRVECLACLAASTWAGGVCRARQKPAARAAFFGLRGVLQSRMTLRVCEGHERRDRLPAQPVPAGDARSLPSLRPSGLTYADVGSPCPADARGGLRRTTATPQPPSPFCLNQSSILCQACSASALR